MTTSNSVTIYQFLGKILQLLTIGMVLLHGSTHRTFAGIMLDTVPEAQYVAFASQFSASGQLGGASGTLIAVPNQPLVWVLTAAHVTGATNFVIGGQSYGIDQFIPEPNFNGNINFGRDIALYRLSTPVVGVQGANLYRGNSEVGQTVALAGFGVGGIGSVGANLGVASRAGTNVIDGLFAFPGLSSSALAADFDAPNGFGAPGEFNTFAIAGSSATPTPLEYHLASLDSGGGMYIFENGEWLLAGVNSGIGSQFNFLNSGSTNNMGYGAFSVFTRVSSFQTFVDGITAVPEPSSILFVSLGSFLFFLWKFQRRFRYLF